MNNPNGLIINSNYVLFHPITGYILGFLLFHFFPPFFSEQGHDWFIIFLDLIGILFFVIGVIDGIIFKKILFGANFKIKASINEDFTLLFLIFTLIIYFARIYLFLNEGVTSVLHHYARQTVGYLPTMFSLLVTPYIMLLWCGVICFKKRYCYWFLFFEFLFQLAIMSKASLFLFAVNGMLVGIYFKIFSKKKRRQFTLALVASFCLIILVGKTIHDARSYIEIGLIPTVDNVRTYSLSESLSFFASRMDTHSQRSILKGYEDFAANMDLEALKGILPKLLGFDEDYEVHPTAVSYYLMEEMGLLTSKSAADFPKSIILYHMGGILAIALFSILFGACFGLLFDMFYSPNNFMFLVFYYFLLSGFLIFGGTGSFISTISFQLLFVVITYSIVILVFYSLKILKEMVSVVHR